jgi:hypothetical protein
VTSTETNLPSLFVTPFTVNCLLLAVLYDFCKQALLEASLSTAGLQNFVMSVCLSISFVDLRTTSEIPLLLSRSKHDCIEAGVSCLVNVLGGLG